MVKDIFWTIEGTYFVDAVSEWNVKKLYEKYAIFNGNRPPKFISKIDQLPW
jgi:hypothetical protein